MIKELRTTDPRYCYHCGVLRGKTHLHTCLSPAAKALRQAQARWADEDAMGISDELCPPRCPA